MRALYCLCLVLLSLLFHSPQAVLGQQCRQILILRELGSPCPYNHTENNSTVYPNPIINETTPNGTVVTLVTALTPVLSNCSRDGSKFLCSALFPRCGSGAGPCLSLCEKIKRDCSSALVFLLNSFADVFNCTRYQGNNPCIKEADEVQPTSSSSSPSATPRPSSTSTPTPSTNESSTMGCPPPSSSYYTESMKSFTKGWLATWSTLCFLSTSLTLLTFIIKPSRFEYPWRPIIYLAFCFNIHSLGYFFSLALGRQIITCPSNTYITASLKWSWGHIPCLITFGLLYYSMVAAFLWWLALTISWFLSAVFKWSNESVGRLAPFFHVTAWVVPLLMMISLIAAQVLSADELTGTCFIVRDNSKATLYGLLIGVVIPLMLFLFTGLLFLIIGLISVCRIRQFLHNKGRQKESIVLEKLMFRIGIFVAVYVIPAAVVIACYLYELVQVPKWITISEAESCSSAAGENCPRASPVVFTIRIFMFLLIGILTGVWIWSKKTLDSWKSLGKRCCCNKQNETMKPAGPISTVNY